MNYHDTMDHLINVITEQEGCSRTMANRLLANALQTRLITDLVLYTIATRAPHPSAAIPEP